MRCVYEVPGVRWLYEYDEPTRDGEKLMVELARMENPGGASSIPKLWHRHGYTATELESWWNVSVYATDERGNCRSKYNPSLSEPKDGALSWFDFEWVLEGTEDNCAKLLREIERRAFGAQDDKMRQDGERGIL